MLISNIEFAQIYFSTKLADMQLICVCVCVRERERERGCVRVCVIERERERERCMFD